LGPKSGKLIAPRELKLYETKKFQVIQDDENFNVDSISN